MAIPVNAATNAYASAAKLLQQARPSALNQVAEAGQGDDFAKMLGQAVQGVVDSGKVADTKAMEMVNGRGDMVDVVTAISQTELAMDTMVTVRDRVISAYEEIMRMPI
ncbi:flagellar hook-basal body complex protein FliE [Devosia sp. ZB163]|uniref:flagellar hook-basal body complex protein FliE n=1 Tax=Devosia sp. ZB163 TaxID=3025938 RepID=UPI00235EAE9B|nr:flagellar hook-basal body complex protein FliE [Devosia sp. ZB163]MDC9824426.1 flagellar hook-basal body complex protein FliE [Devosia sp. ZB163]